MVVSIMKLEKYPLKLLSSHIVFKTIKGLLSNSSRDEWSNLWSVACILERNISSCYGFNYTKVVFVNWTNKLNHKDI